MDRKLVDGKTLTLKLEGDPGAVDAIFSTFNTIDLDGDVTLPGAFEEGAPVRIAAWGHNWGALPVGKGAIALDSAAAHMVGGFFLDTTHGKDSYETVKGLGPLQEWSYGFDVIDSSFGEFNGQKVRFLRKLKVHEVSPVMLGAGIGTGTVDIKSLTFGSITELADEAVATLETYAERVKSRADVLTKEGRTFSQANLDKLTGMLDRLDALGAELRAMLETKPPAADDEAGKLRALYGEFARTQAQLARIGI